MPRRLSPETLALCKPLPHRKNGEVASEHLVSALQACMITESMPASLLFAARRGELSIFSFNGRLHYLKAELEAWRAPQARKERAERKHVARRNKP